MCTKLLCTDLHVHLQMRARAAHVWRLQVDAEQTHDLRSIIHGGSYNSERLQMRRSPTLMATAALQAPGARPLVLASATRRSCPLRAST